MPLELHDRAPYRVPIGLREIAERDPESASRVLANLIRLADRWAEEDAPHNPASAEHNRGKAAFYRELAAACRAHEEKKCRTESGGNFSSSGSLLET